MSQQGFEVDIIWETEAIRFSKQVEDEIRKKGSAQPENSTVKNPENPNAEEPKNKDSNISKNKENLRENSTVKNPTAEEPNNSEADALEESEWAFEAELHDAAGVGPEDYKMFEKYYKINKKKD